MNNFCVTITNIEPLNSDFSQELYNILNMNYNVFIVWVFFGIGFPSLTII